MKPRNKLHIALVGIAAVLLGILIVIEKFDLDPDMIELTGDNEMHSGVISRVSADGVEILDNKNVSKNYVPIIPTVDDKNPAKEFLFLANAHAASVPVCFLTASTVGHSTTLAYNFHKCGHPDIGSAQAIPGTESYASNLINYGLVTLIGFEDGTRAGDKGKSQREVRKFLVLANEYLSFRIQRPTSFGYPNGKYNSTDIGKRFCMARHNMVYVKFNKDMKPVGLWWSPSNSGIYLWTCKVSDAPEPPTYVDLLNDFDAS